MFVTGARGYELWLRSGNNKELQPTDRPHALELVAIGTIDSMIII